MACQPRLLLSEDSENEDDYIDMELFSKVKEVLLCPVCFDVYKNPVNVKQCLHKFCIGCIEDYNRKVKKECPSCRHQMGSRRVLRSDYKISNICNIKVIYPLVSTLINDIDAFNKLEQERRKEIVKMFDFEGFHQKMSKVQ